VPGHWRDRPAHRSPDENRQVRRRAAHRVSRRRTFNSPPRAISRQRRVRRTITCWGKCRSGRSEGRIGSAAGSSLGIERYALNVIIGTISSAKTSPKSFIFIRTRSAGRSRASSPGHEHPQQTGRDPGSAATPEAVRLEEPSQRDDILRRAARSAAVSRAPRAALNPTPGRGVGAERTPRASPGC
jgi:hypothetical protein